MIPTTYIIGAGLGAPFGFPTGQELINKIRQFHNSPYKYLAERYVDDDEMNIAYDKSRGFVKLYDGDRHERKSKFYGFLYMVNKSYIGSIDSFIYRNPEYEYPAKVIIAIELIFSELDNLRYSITTAPPHASKNALGHIWEQIARSDDSITEYLQHRFITFNYDRLIEHFLFHSFKHTVGIQDDEIHKILETNPVRHVYGTIGNYLPDPLTMEFEYHSEPYKHYEFLGNKISDAVHSLRLISPDRAPTEIVSQIAQAFSKTDRVVMLGYGFDPINNAIIRDAAKSVEESSKSLKRDGYRRYTNWYASAMGKFSAELQDAQAMLLMHPNNFGKHDENDVVFMRRLLSNLD